MLHGCLHEDATWENRHALRWSSVAKQPGVRLEWGSPRGPGTKLTSLLAFGTITSKVALNRKLSLVNWRVLPRDGGPTSVYDRKDGEAIYLYWLTDDVCLLAGQRSMNKEARGFPRVSQVRFLTICLLC